MTEIKYLHFAGGFGKQAELPLRHWELVAVRAAQRLHPNATVLLHTQAGSWSNAPAGTETVTYTEAEASEWSGWTCKHGAHMSDRVRLLALLKYGGLYQDTDSFMLRNCDHLAELDTAAAPLQNTKSLANGFVYSPAPENAWLQHVYDQVDQLDGPKGWDYSSVKLYTKAANELPGCTRLAAAKYLIATALDRDKDFFFGELSDAARDRVSNGYVAHALVSDLSYTVKSYLMDNPPPGSVYELVLKLAAG